MDKNEDNGLSESEKVSRFGCGAFLGVFLGTLFIVKLALSSFGVIAAVIAFSVFACGILAVKHGDEFWHSLKNWDWWQ
ncbi:hypothetical protein BCF11_4057 [Collimonas sp. PA-H2]|uniref:hypothetical protein n=1 Tax=Collimonas sp. PA-H2 TaxID=1881062 RepID=UPI000BF5958F|nr:hypothetical protein [Collimonas sp. PA-H2]PFH11605.1 hypothetical protein BCF11_4057 [Collimonas sp. PA-H2]